MKKNFTTLLKSINWLLTGILTLLGYSACDSSEPGADMYGSPHANFTIKGKVVNENAVPIPQIQICIPHEEEWLYTDTLYTDNRGEFNYSCEGFARSKNVTLLLTDIDGELNGGNYAPDSVSVSFKDSDLSGGNGGWYLGQATKEVTLVLKEKKEEDKDSNK